MRKWMVLVLAALLLTGCAGPEAGNTETAPPDTTAVATLPGLYDRDSDVEAQSQGAVRAYPLGEGNYTGILWTGEGILLFSQEQGTRLQLLTGDTCQVEKTGQLEGTIAPGDTGFYPVDQGFAYYTAQSREVVLVNRDLKCANRILLPEDLVGTPVITEDLKQLYYCTREGIRVMDISKGISRMLRSQADSCVTMGQLLFDDTVVTCTMEDGEGSRYTAYLSVQDGQLLGVDAMESALTAAGKSYFLKRMDGILEQMIFGKRGQDSQVFVPRETGEVWPLPQLEGALMLQTGEQTQLDFYAFATGTREASLTLTNFGEIRYVISGEDGMIWFLARDAEKGQDVLYCWDYTQSPSGDGECYIEPWYTGENPDTQGLETLAQRAAEMGDTYGITLRIWQDALENPGTTIPRGEYQTRTVAQALDRLEALFAQLPEEFLEKVGSVTDCGRIRVNLVRSMLTGQTQAQYWQDGNAYVTLAIGENLEADFCRGLYAVLDTYVRNRSNLLDDWNRYQPEGFAYGQTDQQWLEGENRSFVNAQAMAGEREERAELLAAAMLPGNGELFANPVLQQKLNVLCQAIRAAAKWKKDTRSFLWEQYLEEPLAYGG